MSLITWKDSYSVQNETIDKQHKKLVDLINQLHDAMKDGKANDVLEPIFKELVDYTITHFSSEEKIMAENGYPHLDEHKKTHNTLVKEVEKLYQDFNNGSFMLSVKVMTFLRDWLNNHILNEDQKYVPYINK